MKKRLLFLVLALNILLQANAQFNTSPTGTETPCFTNTKTIAHVYENGIHYVAHNYDSDQHAVLKMYDDDCNFLGNLFTVPWYGSSGSNWISRFVDLIYHNGSLYFTAEVNLNESALYQYDLNTNTLNSTRISLFEDIFHSMVIQNDQLYFICETTASSIIAVNANWGNPLPTPYDSSISYAQILLYKINSDMSSPNLVKHLKSNNFSYRIDKEHGTIALQNGDIMLRNFREPVSNSESEYDTFFTRIDSDTGNIIHQETYTGPASISEDQEENLLLTLPSYNYIPSGGEFTTVCRNTFYKLDANFNELIDAGKIAPTCNSNFGSYIGNIHSTDNSYIVESGRLNIQDYEPTVTDEIQSWIYIYMRKSNLQRTMMYSGELLETGSWYIGNEPSRYKKYNVTDNGYDGIGYYDSYGVNNGIPYIAINGSPITVELGGVELPQASNNGYKTFVYHRVITTPEANFTPQLGNDGVAVLPNEKVENGINVVSDEFDSVLVIDNAIDLNSWVGTMIDLSYVNGGQASGWNVWADIPELGIGNIRETNTGDKFFDIAMYDYSELLPFAFGSRAITKTKFQRVYLINEENLEVNDIKKSEFSIYPNPTTDKILVKSNIDIQTNSLQLYSIHGQSLKETSLYEIDLSDLSTGIYFLKIQTEKGFITKKIIKN